MAKTQLIYNVLVCRTDGQHIVAIESSDYDKCFAKWVDLHKVWSTAAKEQTPFVLVDPVVTAFAPAMVYEIKLIPVMTEEMAQKASNNPYAQRMNQHGLSQTFPGNSVDLLSNRG